MARKRQFYYSGEVERIKISYYESLPEKQARHFLGQEYLELGPGSQRYLADVFSCSRHTIKKGVNQVSAPDFKPDYSRQRVQGGGRKKKKKA